MSDMGQRWRLAAIFAASALLTSNSVGQTLADAQKMQAFAPGVSIDAQTRPTQSGTEGLSVTYALGHAQVPLVLKKPSSWAGASNLRRFIDSATIVNGTLVGNDEEKWTVRPDNNGDIVVRYWIKATQFAQANWFGEPLHGSNWYFAFGPVLLSTFSGIGNTSARLSAGKGVFSNLPELSVSQKIYGRPPDPLEAFYFVGSDVQIASVVRDDQIRVAFPRSAPDDLSGFAMSAGRMFDGMRRAFNQPSSPYSLAVVPFGPAQRFQGTAFPGGAALQTHGADFAKAKWEVAHELSHEWLPLQMGGLDSSKNAIDQYWFSEGFNDFLSRLLLLRSGGASFEEFIKEWNETMHDYAVSPARNMDAATLRSMYWRDADAGRIPYLRGSLLALRWQGGLVEAKARDDLQSRLEKMIRLRNSGSAILRLQKIMAGSGINIASDIERFVVRGETIELSKKTFGPCAIVEKIRLPTFDRGFVPKKRDDGGWTATNVDPASHAYRAGIRDGMHLLELIGGNPQDSTVDYTFRVEVGQKIQTIAYRPAGKRTVEVQTVRPVRFDRSSRNHVACEARAVDLWRN